MSPASARRGAELLIGTWRQPMRAVVAAAPSSVLPGCCVSSICPVCKWQFCFPVGFEETGGKLLLFCSVCFLSLDCFEAACLVSARVNNEWIILFLLYSANEDLGTRVCCYVCGEHDSRQVGETEGVCALYSS